jgi:hypothetical protein
MGND